MIRRFSYRPGDPPRPSPPRTDLEEVPQFTDGSEDEARAHLDEEAAAIGEKWKAKPGADGTRRDTEWHGWRGET